MGEENIANGIVGEWWDKVLHSEGDQVALSVSELADLSERIDAALRRAKAEGQQDAIKLMLEVAIIQGQTGNINCKNAIVDAVNVVRGEIDARAAQIEASDEPAR